MTAVYLSFSSPPLTFPSLVDDQLFILHFIPDTMGRNAWDSTLGYSPNQIYREIPCVITGLVGLKISCDLYTYITQDGPYNNLMINDRGNYPFITVYGYDRPISDGSAVTIHIPAVKLSS